MDPIQVGEFRHRLAYQTRSSGLDSANQPSATWTTVSTFWARVTPLRGMELYNARQNKGTTSHKIEMRNQSSVATIQDTGRFLFEGETNRVFGIDQVFRVDERNAYLSIHCSELISPQ